MRSALHSRNSANWVLVYFNWDAFSIKLRYCSSNSGTALAPMFNWVTLPTLQF